VDKFTVSVKTQQHNFKVSYLILYNTCIDCDMVASAAVH